MLAGNQSRVSAAVNSLSIVPVMDQGNVNENWANFELRIINTGANQRFFINSIGQACCGRAVAVCNSSATVPMSSYWLGTWYDQNNIQFTVYRLILTRRA